jgi:CheY-like chemotaxis protein
VVETTIFLLVEDDANDVLMLKMEFAHASVPIRLEVVEDGREAIRYLEGAGQYGEREQYPVPHVILLDLKMPRINGFEFLEWLRSKGPREHRFIPVVVMSSSALKEDVDRAYSLGANSYMVKPVSWALFKERIKAMGIYWAEHVQKL